MASIMSAVGEYFVGDRDKGVAIYSLLDLEHCRRMKADGKIKKAAQQRRGNMILREMGCDELSVGEEWKDNERVVRVEK